jgi:hypothetical protein
MQRVKNNIDRKKYFLIYLRLKTFRVVWLYLIVTVTISMPQIQSPNNQLFIKSDHLQNFPANERNSIKWKSSTTDYLMVAL